MKKIVFLLGLVLGGLTEGWGQNCTPSNLGGNASSCNRDINTGNGLTWQREKLGVVYLASSTPSCNATGFILNPASGNRDSIYILTASHAIWQQSTATNTNAYFNYEGSGLRGSGFSVSGTTILSYARNLDFCLLRLRLGAQALQNIGSCFNPYYLGWDISGTDPRNFGIGIHHASSSPKKYAITAEPVVSTDFTVTGNSDCTQPPIGNRPSTSFWEVDWTEGTTEPGASGSPLINLDRRCIGILSGNNPISPCEDDFRASYQKLSSVWTAQSLTGETIKAILDPEDSNVQKIDGYYPNPNNDPTINALNAANSYESNNTVATAEDVFARMSARFTGFLRSYIQTATDNDYFKIKLNGKGRLKLTLKDKPQGYNLKIIVGNQVINALPNVGTAAEIEVFDKITEGGQDVYALIENNGAAGSTTPYKLQVEFLDCADSYEPNEWYNQANSTAFPQNLGEMAVMRTIKAPISDGDDEDWYAIGVDATGTLTLDLTDLPYDYNLQLYNLLGQPIATSATNGLANERVSKLHNQLQSTIYYARVYRVTNQFSICEPYTLKLTWQPSSACVAATPSVQTTSESAAGARDGAVRLTVTGGATPYTFSWNNGATTQNISNLSGGRYSVTITTADGCRTTTTATVPTTGSIAPYCDATTTLTSNSATFSDGSGTADYAPFSDCRWLIQPTNAQNITLNFTAFALGANDTVFVYDGHSTAAPLLGKFSSSLAPSPLVSSGGRLYIRFMTNASSQAAGWTARYSTTLVQETEKLVGYEYWFDNNDNNRISRFFTPITARLLDIRLNTEGLSDGLHTVHFRTKDENGVYSSVVSQFFTKEKPKEATPEMVYWEYWYDDNHNDRTVEGFPYGENMVIDDYVLPPDSLTIGLHTLHARFQDINGEWSSVISRFFYKNTPSVSDNKIKAYRFWFDDATQNMQTKVVNPPSDIIALDSTLNVSTLGVGRHLIHFQHQDLNNVWSSVITDTFLVYFQPSARFTYQNVNCTNGQVQFTNSSTEATSYLWRFPNGITSTLATPMHTFSSSGDFDVTLIASNGGGFRDSITQRITVTNTAATIVITPNTNVTICQRDTATLTASGGTTYRWSNGQTTPSIKVTQTGVYSLIVTNSNGCTGTASRNVTVQARPTVDFGFNIQGGRVIFSNLSSGATSYLWKFANDSTSTLLNPTTTYRANGLYRVCLTANNNQNCPDSICKNVNVTRVAVQELPEGLNFKVSPNPTSGILDVYLSFYKPFQNNDKLVIRDMLGKQLLELNQIKPSNQFDMSNLANGTYLLCFYLDNHVYILEKVVKNN